MSLRLTDLVIPGKDENLWPGIDHIEVFLHPLAIDMSKELYKDIYSFVFPPVDEEPPLVYERTLTRSRQVKPLDKRVRLPRFYRYVNVNEIKLALSIKNFKLNNAKIKLSTFTAKNKLKNTKELFDLYIKHAKRNLYGQVTSVIKQKLLKSDRSNFLVDELASSSKGLFGSLRAKKRDQPAEGPEEAKANKLDAFFTG